MAHSTRWTMVTATLLTLALAGLARADSGFFGMAGGTPDAQCEQEAHDLQFWLESLADRDTAQLSTVALDDQLLLDEFQPRAARAAAECPAVGWALMRVGDATGSDKAAALAGLLPEAIAQCECAVDIAALRTLVWQLCVDDDREPLAGAAIDEPRAARRAHEREDRSIEEIEETEPQRTLAQHRGPGNPRAPRRTARDQAETPARP